MSDITQTMQSLRDRITSMNSVPLDVVRVPAAEIAALLDHITRLQAALDDAQAEASVAKVAAEALRAALRRTILMYAVDDDAWDREAAADRAVQAAINAAREAQK
jgi:hypothetical protein